MALTPGTRLGQYEIVSTLGAGGMGEVYRARDPRLDRDVAVKVLSADLATDPAALARFEREAMSVARLSHPNILSIFEFGRDDGTAFVVTELVEGETLRTRLESGALPARRAVAYALQIARGMAAAHGRGVVHRDLKPENVMITRDDQVKILDFGLAKSTDAAGTDETRIKTMVTTAGMVLGTFGYMAPEQVRGVALDHRADMFAFGAVLYEMLSGERAFKGETAADTMTAVLTKDPPELDAARLSISSGLDRILRRCLEKSPELRFQSATDLAFALETLSAGPSTSSANATAAPQAARPARVAWLPWTVAAAAIVAAVGLWFGRESAPEVDARWNYFTRVSEAAGEETSPALSPDGGTVAYAAHADGNWNIYSQRVGGRNATPIVADPERNERGVMFSPDGSLIAFHESDGNGGIFVAGATGEAVRRVTDIGFDPAWSPDGTQIAFASEEINDPSSRYGDSTLWVVSAGGGTPRKVIESDAVQPSWSPSGDRLVYWSNIGGQRDIYTVAAGGGDPVAVTMDPAIDWSPVWSPDGRFIYFSSDRGVSMNLWRIPVDQSTGRPLGAAEPVTAGVQASAALPRFSREGTRLAFRSRVGSVNPVAIPFDSVALRAGVPVLLDTQNNIRIPSDASPDGTQLAYYSIGEQQEDLFIGPVNGPLRRVTDDAGRDRAPVFTPDGRSLMFYSNRDGRWAIWTIGVDGGGLRKVAGAERGAVYVTLSPKGDRVAFSSDANNQLFTAPVAPTSGTVPADLQGIGMDGGDAFAATGWSPDGSRLAGIFGSSSGRPTGVGVYDLGTRTATILSSDQSFSVKWLADSRRVVYFTRNGSELVVLDTATRQRTPIEVRLPGPSSEEMMAISPDNRTIYYGAVRAQADIWIVERK